MRNSQPRLELCTESLYSMAVSAFALFSSGILFFLSSICLANAAGGSSSMILRNDTGAGLSPSYRSVAYFVNWVRHLCTFEIMQSTDSTQTNHPPREFMAASLILKTFLLKGLLMSSMHLPMCGMKPERCIFLITMQTWRSITPAIPGLKQVTMSTDV